MDAEKIAAIFRKKGLRATPQRIAVYEFLIKNRIHPSAEEIYAALIKQYPAFSRTTIYNSLNTLVKNGLAVAVKINQEMVRYDACVELHGHFVCDKCKNIYDFAIETLSVKGLEGFKTVQKDVYFSGLCAGCNK